jgi:hypothetical protein
VGGGQAHGVHPGGLGVRVGVRHSRHAGDDPCRILWLASGVSRSGPPVVGC